MEGGFLLNVVISQCTAILKLLAGEDETLLIRGNALLVLNLSLHVVYRVRRLDLKRDGLPSERLHEDLHAATETEDWVAVSWFRRLQIRFDSPRWRVDSF